MVVPDRSAQKAALLAGQIDVLPQLLPSDLPLDPVKVTTEIMPGLEWNALLIQTTDPLFRDPRVRRAIAMAIDMPKLATAVNYGISSRPNPSPIPIVSRWHSSGQDRWVPFDPVAAKHLLSDTDYRGQPIKLETNERFPNMFDTGIMLEAMLSRIGLDIQLDVVDWATQLANYRSGRFRLMTFGYTARVDPSLEYSTFIGDKANVPFMQWDDPEARSLAGAVAATADAAERQKLCDRIQADMAAEIPIIPLFNLPVIDAFGKAVSGYAAWAGGKPRLWNVSIDRSRS